MLLFEVVVAATDAVDTDGERTDRDATGQSKNEDVVNSSTPPDLVSDGTGEGSGKEPEDDK